MFMGEEDGREQRGVMTKPRRRKTQDARRTRAAMVPISRERLRFVRVSCSLSLSRRDGRQGRPAAAVYHGRSISPREEEQVDRNPPKLHTVTESRVLISPGRSRCRARSCAAVEIKG
jgi:hypothetical protein